MFQSRVWIVDYAISCDAIIGNTVRFGNGPVAVIGNEHRNKVTAFIRVWEGAVSRFEPEVRRPALR